MKVVGTIKVNGQDKYFSTTYNVNVGPDEQLKAADTLSPLPTAEETLTTRGIDPAMYRADFKDCELAAIR